MRIAIIALCMGMIGCAPPPEPASRNREIAGLGIIYGSAMVTYIIGHRDEDPAEVEIACRHLAGADDIAKDVVGWPKEYVETFGSMAEFRAACAKKVTEN